MNRRRSRWRLGVAALVLPVAGCVPTPRHADLAALGPTFAPEVFFAGKTVGEGMLRVVFSHAKPVHVEGQGRTGPDGTLTLVQRVEEQDKPARMRSWRLRQRPDGGYDATLSDAVGPVDVEVQANLLHIRFTMKGRLGVEQWIYLQPDGRSALNRMVVRKFGIPVAALHETIRKIG
ncbi:hypothetical protein GGQ80_002318 [Sphingomonas jinjuensis]|uniref:DUF3833 family protein n=1 Tax=Sphingomonas jinjuensis TaxID=535907 RepID=A0A840FM83_9SPHN|nr:DUF3833 family protein [Sphingomonas jinjuensis]MBB4154405.1 hypothetical protein [Sphingomonas jinjuensis]